MKEGEIYASPPLKGEIKNHDGTHEMPRLVFKFNKQSFGRLNKMIRSINEWVNWFNLVQTTSGDDGIKPL